MTEISLNILDIANNSVKADAKNVKVTVSADTKADRLSVSVKDDGKGMSEEFVKNVCDPFTTTRTTRKVGLGIPLFKESAEMTGGEFHIRSKLGEGTETTAVYVISSIDRVPLGDLTETMLTLIGGSGDTMDFELSFSVDGNGFEFSTVEVRAIMDGIPITSPEVIEYLREYLNENIKSIIGGLEL